MTGSEGALSEAKALFVRAGLPCPYIPTEMAPRLQKRGEWCYASCDVQVAPYAIDRYVAEARSPMPNYVLLAHAGHGINSYAIHYFLVRGWLALFVQAAWGGVYMNAPECVAVMQQYFDCAEGLIRAIPPSRSPSQRFHAAGRSRCGLNAMCPRRSPRCTRGSPAPCSNITPVARVVMIRGHADDS